MLIRAAALFGLALVLFIGTFAFYNETVISWFWLIATYVRLAFLRAWGFVAPKLWLMFRANVVEVVVRELRKPLMFLAARIAIGPAIIAFVERKVKRLMSPLVSVQQWFSTVFALIPVRVKLTVATIAFFAILVASIFWWQVGFALFAFGMPAWLTAAGMFLTRRLWRMGQQMLVRTVVVQPFRFAFRYLPREYVAQYRAFNFKLMREFVRRRELTLEQVQKLRRSRRFRAEVALDRMHHRREAPKLSRTQQNKPPLEPNLRPAE